MGSSAQVNKITTLVGSHFGAIVDLRGNERYLEWVVREEI